MFVHMQVCVWVSLEGMQRKCVCVCACRTCAGEGTSGFDTLCHTFAPPRGQTAALTGTFTGQSVISCLYSLLLWCHFLFATCPLLSPPTASDHWTELWKQWFLDCVCQIIPVWVLSNSEGGHTFSVDRTTSTSS